MVRSAGFGSAGAVPPIGTRGVTKMAHEARFAVGPSQVVLLEGDITQQEVDAVVNAANRHLAGGGGVDGAIHRAGGPSIMEETRRRYPQGCPTGEAVITGAGNLPARFVIHAVGPVWRGGSHGERELLAGAYRRSLQLAVENGCRSIAFPALSAGAYGYPAEEAAEVALRTVRVFLEEHGQPQEVRFVLFGKPMWQTFERVAKRLWEAKQA